MRKVILFNLVTLDGFFEGPNQDISWHNVDEEFNEFAINQLNETGTLLFGRVTYQVMASYWPTESAIRDDPTVAGLMNSLPKVVFSKTLDTAEWNNSRLVKEVHRVVEEVSELKRQPGKDIAIFGSSDLAATLAEHGLIDEYRIMVVPVFLGDGRSLLRGIKEKLNLKLLRVRTFKSGNVLLYYGPDRK
ncbi:MAG TPA: dihydrofolate reductase family protein [Anaerolineales bacterium]|nr:dihydrofolate reductase family protein [Anaerolineales bacterium]